MKALPEALQIAREQGLDLVEVAAAADPPVCKIMDHGKYKYEQDQRRKESKRKASNVVIKEMKFRPKIDGHDYTTKMKHVERFLEEGSKVKLTIMFRGREMAHPELGMKILSRVADDSQKQGVEHAAVAVIQSRQRRPVLPRHVAQQFGSDAVGLVEKADGSLANATVNGENAGADIELSQHTSAGLQAELARLEARIKAPGLTTDERTELNQRIDALHQQLGGEKQLRQQKEVSIATTPVSFAYSNTGLFNQGGNPFGEYQLPEAALALKQGVGRLIRSEQDEGVVVICDPRLVTRGYGRVLLKSLPPRKRLLKKPLPSPKLKQPRTPSLLTTASPKTPTADSGSPARNQWLSRPTPRWRSQATALTRRKNPAVANRSLSWS